MDLRRVFSGVAWKRLTDVEADGTRSNQHELNGVAALRTILGEPVGTMRIPTRFHFIPDDSQEALSADGFVSWYDARENQAHRSPEYRLYYPGNEVSDSMNPGDLVVLARQRDVLHWLLAPAGSTGEAQLTWLFSLEDRDSGRRPRLHAKSVEIPGGRSWFSVRQALEALGIDLRPDVQARNRAGTPLDALLLQPDQPWSGLPIDRWVEQGLPVTAEFSIIARDSLGDFNEMARLDPDDALARAMEREERIFVEWERKLLEERVSRGFESVEDFLEFSISVQNRRKSRAGHAFEHHIAAVLVAQEIRFERNAITENNARPDFLMPSAAGYHDPGFPPALLDMLGAKTTCKDRWRQVLSEASRIQRKHLVTLEPAISRMQTDEMQSHGLQLVLPRELHPTFRGDQRRWLMSVSEFCAARRASQRDSGSDLFDTDS